MTDPDRTPRPPPSAPALQPADPTARVSKWVAGLLDRLGSWGSFKAPPQQEKSATDLAEYRTTLAVHRTLMGADRSLMAWIRTALSMVSFGFTIYKILQGFQAGGATFGAAGQPRVVAMFLIGVGNVSILLGIVEYWQRAKDLSSYEDVPIWRPSFVMAVAIAILSVALFVAVIFKAL